MAKFARDIVNVITNKTKKNTNVDNSAKKSDEDVAEREVLRMLAIEVRKRTRFSKTHANHVKANLGK